MLNKKILISALISVLLLLFIFFNSSPQQNNNQNLAETFSKNKLDTFDKKQIALEQNKALTNSTKIKSSKDEIKTSNEKTNEAIIIDCTEQAIKNDQSINIDENEDYINYIETLSQSSNTEDKLAKQIHQFRNKSLHHLKQYSNLLTEQPSNKLIYMRVLQQCFTDFDLTICDESLFQKATNIDKDNAMLWHSIAAIKLKNNDIESALEALKEANKKREYNNYYYEFVTFLEQNLKHNSNLNFQERLLIASGVSGANVSFIIPIFKFCEDNFFTQTYITDICYQTGKHLKNHGKNQLTRLLGLNLLKLFYKFNDNDEMIKTTEKDIKRFSSLYQSKTMQKSMALMSFDERLARDWLNLSLDQGEHIALQQLIEDAILYSKNPDYNPCPAL